MSGPNRRELLERMQNDLSQYDPEDAKSQELLADTRAHIQRAIDDDDHESLPERLQESVLHFEATHPDLANAITIFIDSLSNAGL
jgi:hypothetical protein